MGADLAGYLVTLLVSAIIYVVWQRRRTPESRREAAWRWARRHQATVDPRWSPEVQEQLRAHTAIGVAGIYVGSVVLVNAPRSLSAVAASLAALPILLGIAQGFAFARQPLAPGPRIARLREPTLVDYIPWWTRALMWGSALAGCVATLVAAASRSEPFRLPVSLLLPAAALAVEIVGARMARQPEPAEDPSHLYWQDAFRADLIRGAAWYTTYAAGFLCLLTPQIAGLDSDLATVAWWTIGAMMVGLVLVDALTNRDHPARYMRTRLWPTLAVDQVLEPGDPVPVVAA
jgi:hypothetical protein